MCTWNDSGMAAETCYGCILVKVAFCRFAIENSQQFIPALPHQAGIELSDFHARVWKSDQGGRNSMQEMHGNQTKCMEFQPIKENSNF